MNKYFIVVASAFVYFISNRIEVKVAGEMKNIMHKGDLSAHIALDTLLSHPHVYGLGPAEGIKGELMIIDSKAYWCKVENGKTTTTITNNAKAAMLVYVQVPSWKSVAVTNEIKDYAALEKMVEELASKNGQNLDEPFPFMIKGNVAKSTYHVIDWKDGTQHTFDNHKKFAKYGSIKNESVTLLGFYSNKHHSIFTHHTTNLHVHIMDDIKTIVGHLEEISTGTNSMKLLIPLTK